MRGEGEAKEIEKAAEDKRKEDTVSLKSLHGTLGPFSLSSATFWEHKVT